MRSNSTDSEGRGAALSLPIPVRDGSLFKHRASAPILNFLADNPEFDLSIRQLSRITPVSDRATGQAVDALAANSLVEVEPDRNARRVRLARERFEDHGDPIERIPQVAYRTPVRVARHYLEDELDGVRGIVLFGSVARGQADRRSDIDLWVLIDGDSTDLLAQRDAANALERTLEGLQIPPSIAYLEDQDRDFASRWPEIREQLEADGQDWRSAERYSFELVVETPASIEGQSKRVEPAKLFGEGITLVESNALDEVKRTVVGDE